MTSALGILVLAAFLIYSLMSIVRPMWAFALLVMMWALEQLVQSYVPFFLANGILFNIYVAAIVGLAALRRVGSGGFVLGDYFNATFLCITALYLVGIASLAWTPGFDFAQRQVLWLGPYIFVGVYLATMLPRRVEEFDDFRKVIMIVGGLIALLILLNPNLQWHGDRAMVKLGGAAGDRGNPLALAELGAILAVTAAISRDQGIAGFKLALRIAIVILGLGLALKTGSRGQVLAAFVVIAFLYPTARRSDRLGQTMLNLTGLGFFAIVLFFTVTTFVTSENLDRWSLRSILEGGFGRLEFVMMYFKAFIDSPQAWLFGFGSMAFGEVVSEGGVRFVENLFAEIIFEFGIIGMLLLAVILGQSFSMGIWMIRNAPTSQARINSTLLLGLWLMYFLIAAKSYNLWTGFPFFYICVTMTKCGLVARREWPLLEEEYEEEDEEEYAEDYLHSAARPIS